MILIERFLSGLELRDPSRPDPRPLDFAVTNDTGTLLMLANWWTVSWGMGTGILFVPAVLNPKTLLFDGLESTGLCVSTATDGFFADLLQAARLHTDLDRGNYYRELQKLVDFEPSFDVRPWVEEYLARPTIDARASIRARQTAMREIGTIVMRNGEGRVVDVLAIDALGQVATMQDEGWLALFATTWARYAAEARPNIGSFLGWLAQQRPYGPFSLDDPQVTAAEGELDAFVNSAQSASPTT